MSNPGKQLVAVCVAFIVFSWFFVLLRCFVRFKIVKSFGWDDRLMIITLFLSTLFSAFLIVSVHHGTGKHISTLDPNQIEQALKYQVFAEIVYVLATLFIKLSIGFLLLRIAARRLYRYTLYGSMGIMTVWTFVAFLIILLQCRPMKLSWDPNWSASTEGGHCMDRIIFRNLTYAFSAIDIFFDWGYALLPIPMLWGLQTSKQVKISLLVVLSLGAFASTTTLVRFRYLVTVEHVTDFLFSTSRLVWSVIGLDLGIAAACMSTLRPLFRNWRFPGFSSGHSRPHRNFATGANTENQYGLGYMGTNRVTQSSTVYTQRRISDDHTSQESIIEHNGIQKRVDVEVVHER